MSEKKDPHDYNFQHTRMREFMVGVNHFMKKFDGALPEGLFVKRANDWMEAVIHGGMSAFCLTRPTPVEVAHWPSDQVGVIHWPMDDGSFHAIPIRVLSPETIARGAKEF